MDCDDDLKLLANEETELVQCMICGKILECSRNGSDVLIKHIMEKHKELEVDFTPQQTPLQSPVPQNRLTIKCNSPAPSEAWSNRKLRPGSAQRSTISNHSSGEYMNVRQGIRIRNTAGLSYGGYTSGSDIDNATPRIILYQPYTRYWDSIEKWRPASSSKIFCPLCICETIPDCFVRTDKSCNGCLSFCIKSCWPFCFMPCLWPVHTTGKLYCGKCNEFLGTYDFELNCFKPKSKYLIGMQAERASRHRRE